MTTPVTVPPKPTRDPDVHLKDRGASKKPRTLKGDIEKLRGKASEVRSKWTTGRQAAAGKKREVRRKAGDVLAPAKKRVSEERQLADETVKSIYKAIGSVRSALDPAKGKARPYVTSFLISCVISWALGPQVLVAIYERLWFHTSTTSWGVLHGPGRWFRDTVGMAAETGQMFGLIAAICLGVTPMFLFSVRNMVAKYLAESPYYGKAGRFAIRWLARAPYLVPTVYLIGVAYPQYVTPVFGSPWRLEMWHFYVAGLFCTTYYFTMWVFDRIERLRVERQAMSAEEQASTQTMGPGMFHALLMVPLASIISGALLYTPNAAW